MLFYASKKYALGKSQDTKPEARGSCRDILWFDTLRMITKSDEYSNITVYIENKERGIDVIVV